METQTLAKANQRLVITLICVVVGMFGFGYALVPLYNVFCEITGINGKGAGRMSAQTALTVGIDKQRLVTVEFVATVNGGLPWEFKPLRKQMTVHPGELSMVSYVASNQADHAVVGQAIPSISPGYVATYFSKTECFCFTQQTLAAGETREMPVRFIVDPNLPKEVSTVTLSYTFFNTVRENL